MNENETKAAVLRALLEGKSLTDGTALASELAVAGQRRRIDLAVLGATFIGFEIKSQFDTLRRLEKQTAAFLPYFDELRVVVAARHIRKAVGLIPKEASLWVILDERVELVQASICQHAASTEALLQLLTSAELRRSFAASSQVPRNELVCKILALPDAQVRETARSAIRSKFLPTTTAFLRHADTAPLNEESLRVLSRFKEKRHLIASAFEARQLCQAAWQAAAPTLLAKQFEQAID